MKYNLNLNERAFNAIVNKTKRIEIRTNTENTDYSKMNKGDIMNYMDTLRSEVKDYFKLLSKEYPSWLDEYINTKELLKQQYISVTCGKVYARMFNIKSDFSSLEHSIAVALIIWNFTHDKKQTLSGLFHDISTPAFKHCVDYLNKDYMKQESTEDLTTTIIKNSNEIMTLLKRDNIKLEEVCNYHIYPIADNDIPMLSADRLEYSLSNSIIYNIDTLDNVKTIYEDISIQKNEKGIIELGFKTKEIAEYFISNTSKLSICYRDDETRYYMQFIADIIKRLNEDNLIKKDDLYSKKESEIIDLILLSKYAKLYKKVISATKVNTSLEEPENVYFVHHGAKIRYIDPLVNSERISKISKVSKNKIDKNLSYKMNKYVYLDDINF